MKIRRASVLPVSRSHSGERPADVADHPGVEHVPLELRPDRRNERLLVRCALPVMASPPASPWGPAPPSVRLGPRWRAPCTHRRERRAGAALTAIAAALVDAAIRLHGGRGSSSPPSRWAAPAAARSASAATSTCSRRSRRRRPGRGGDHGHPPRAGHARRPRFRPSSWMRGCGPRGRQGPLVRTVESYRAYYDGGRSRGRPRRCCARVRSRAMPPSPTSSWR